MFICLSAAPLGYWLDESKTSGFRAGLSWKHAAVSMLSTQHNEFWNIVTDVVPAIFFGVLGLACWANVPSVGSSFSMEYCQIPRTSLLATLLATAFQHVTSLLAHAFSCVSPRLSYSIWFIDYAGILLEFVWNAPPMAFVLHDQAYQLWPAWAALNVVITFAVLTFTLHLTRTYDFRKVGDTTWHAVVKRNGVGSVAIASLLVIPNFALTALVGFAADPVALLVLLGLPFALAVKESHFPEGTRPTGRFDYSLFHSHSLWHILVCGIQAVYLTVFIRALLRKCDSATG